VKIVGVHGIAQQYRSGPERTQEWLLGVRGGLEAAGFRSIADGLTTSDLRVAFFGDLFRPDGTMAADFPPYTASSLGPGEIELMSALYNAAIEIEPDLGPPVGAMVGRRRPSVQVMLDRLLRSKTFSGVAKRMLIGNLKQVTEYLQDETVRQAVLERLAREMSEDVQVVVGHSLGSVVAYEYCCSPGAPNVALLITLGSPLGIPNLIFERLKPPPSRGMGAWPEHVGRWVNVAAMNDIVALRKELAPQFTPGPGGARLVDRIVDNGDEPHEASRYRNSRQTGEAVGTALSDAQS
jgi:hypothetical protein